MEADSSDRTSRRDSSSFSSCDRMPSSMFMVAADRKFRAQKARSAPMPPVALAADQLLYAHTYVIANPLVVVTLLAFKAYRGSCACQQ